MLNDERMTNDEAQGRKGTHSPRPFSAWGFVLLSSLGVSSFVIPPDPAGFAGLPPFATRGRPRRGEKTAWTCPILLLYLSRNSAGCRPSGGRRPGVHGRRTIAQSRLI